nr:hypothetical protein [uncultured Cohaesibacter sp.]
MTFILSLFTNWRVVLGVVCGLGLLVSHGVAYWKGYSNASQAYQMAALAQLCTGVRAGRNVRIERATQRKFLALCRRGRLP